ncbi:MAG: hypothetical protein ACKOE5_07145, partial [Cytophagales bacterium]
TLVNALSNNNLPIPNAYRTTFEYILNADLVNCFQREKINTKEMERISLELTRWSLKIEDPVKISRLASESIFEEIKRVGADVGNEKRLQLLKRVFPLIEKFNIDINFYKSQNLYFEISTEGKKGDESPEWHDQFVVLGFNLGVKVEA